MDAFAEAETTAPKWKEITVDEIFLLQSISIVEHSLAASLQENENERTFVLTLQEHWNVYKYNPNSDPATPY